MDDHRHRAEGGTGISSSLQLPTTPRRCGLNGESARIGRGERGSVTDDAMSHRSPDARGAAKGPGNITGRQSARSRECAAIPIHVRLRVAVALAQAGDPDAVAAVTTALASPVADIRLTAAEAFRSNPTEASRAAVRSALGEANPLTRAHAAALLGDSEESTRTLVDLLNSENPTVREEAARTVEDRFSENIPIIRSLLDSQDPWLQLYGAGALLSAPSR